MPHILYKKESYTILGACFDVYKAMGTGFLKAVYCECLTKEFVRQKIPFATQPNLTLYYKHSPIHASYQPDLVCYENIIVEIGTQNELQDSDRSRVLNALRATGLNLGILVTFGSDPKLLYERIINPT